MGRHEQRPPRRFTIRGGFADFPADNISNRGGGLVALFGATTVISDCKFIDNHANDFGGAAFFFQPSGSPGISLRNTTFEGNRSFNGGGAVYFFAPGIKAVANCSFLGNDANAAGGGLGGDVTNMTMVNSVFIDNSCGSSGGVGLGGGLACTGGPPTRVINCTFAGNRTGGRGGAGISQTSSNAAPTLSNCILWGNRDNAGTDERAQIDRLFPAGSLATVQFSIVQGLSGTPPFISGAGNAGADPLFVDLDGANNIVGDSDDDVRLLAASPAIEAGDATLRPADTLDLDGDANIVELVPLDRDGAARVQCVQIDMGAYESSAGAGAVEITCPAPATVQCGGDTSPAATGTPTTSGCGTITVTYTDAVTPGVCSQESTITRTWVASNGSASDSCDQIIEVVDTTAPTLTLPANVGIQCDDSTDPTFTGVATGVDNCGPTPTIAYSDVVTAGACPNRSTITRTWTATDLCGNVASAAQIISVGDNTLAVLTVPPNVAVSCGQPTNPSATGVATAVDACDADPNVSYFDAITPGSCAAETTITRTWTAVDACGNVTEAVQLITVVDDAGPAITLPSDAAVGCTDSTAPEDTGFATATDLCGSATVTYADSVAAGACPSQQIITRTWTAVDGCDNVSTDTQIISVSDVVAPLLTVPADATRECTQSTHPDYTGYASASDACPGTPPIVAYSDEVTSAACVEHVFQRITRTWTATDACGNAVSQPQLITITDNTPPTLSVPADITIACGDSTDTALTGMASAADACDPAPMVTFADNTAVGVCPEVSVVTRVWTATDACGNSVSGSQRIALIDETPPEIECPADVEATAPCGSCGVRGLNLGFAVATDNCSEVVVTNDAPHVFRVGTTIVTWTATDACGLTATCTQQVTVEDEMPPIVFCRLCTTMLWPPNHDLVNVGLSVFARDLCGPVTTTIRVYSDEDDDEQTGDGIFSPDAKNQAAGTLRLRAERNGNENGRVYLIVVEAEDVSGNADTATCTVVVPHGRNAASMRSVMTQALVAEVYFRLSGNPPPGFVLVGDGPIIGPKQ